MDRRFFLGSALASAVGATLSACGGGESDPVLDLASSDRRTTTTTTTTTTTAASAAVKSRVIVIGGGMGGATVAKYLRLWGDAISVTLVERMPTYTSNIMSSLVLSGQRSLSSLSYNYDTLRSKYGITTVFGEVVAIDPVAGKVTLANKTVLTADRIVMAPGISFDTVPGLGSSDKMPHAWQAGPQTTLLANQLKALPSKGVVVLTIPKTPYRCPPGPYERACLIADWLKAKKPGSKLIVLDANPGIVTEVDNFTNAFMGLHGNVIEYHANAEVTSVDPASMSLFTTAGTIRGDVINKAGLNAWIQGVKNFDTGVTPPIISMAPDCKTGSELVWIAQWHWHAANQNAVRTAGDYFTSPQKEAFGGQCIRVLPPTSWVKENWMLCWFLRRSSPLSIPVRVRPL